MSDFRTRLGGFVDGMSDDEIKQLLTSTLAGSGERRKQKWVYCPCGCKHSWQEEFLIPDTGKGIKDFLELVNQAKGKPAETKQITVDITARTISELEELSDAELAELAAAEEGQWELLPASGGA